MKKLLTFTLILLLCLSGCSSIDSTTQSETKETETQQTESSSEPAQSQEPSSDADSSQSDSMEEISMRISVTDGKNTVVFHLNETPPAKSLYDSLPLEVEVENYSNNEKIFYPPNDIDKSDGIEGDCEAGTIALFSPWGNVVMYYSPASSYPGLYILGEAVEGVDLIKNLSGTIWVTVLN